MKEYYFGALSRKSRQHVTLTEAVAADRKSKLELTKNWACEAGRNAWKAERNIEHESEL